MNERFFSLSLFFSLDYYNTFKYTHIHIHICCISFEILLNSGCNKHNINKKKSNSKTKLQLVYTENYTKY
jgi:hypothetical protein